MEELVVILIDDLDRLSAIQKSRSVSTDAEDVARVVNGRESPPPEAPPKHQVEGRLAQIKLILIGDGEKQIDIVRCHELAAALLKMRTTEQHPYPLISRLILCMKDLPFECRKDVALIFSHLFERDEIFWNEVKNFNTKTNQPMLSKDEDQKSLFIHSSLKLLLLQGMIKDIQSPETDESSPETADESEITSNNATSTTSTIVYPDMMKALVNGCGMSEVSLNSGVMIRTTIKDPMITARFLKFPVAYVYPFFEATPGSFGGGFLDEMNFDIASDAFATIKDLFTRHKASGVVRDFMLENYAKLFGEDESDVTANPIPNPNSADQSQVSSLVPNPPTTTSAPSSSVAAAAGGGGGIVDDGEQVMAHINARLIGLYGGLLSQSRNFFTRRQSLKLLAELLLDRINFNIMMKFISSKHNLKLVMNLLIDSSKNIQFEAFHVFKVFVANPRKPPQIITALVRNKDRLLKYLDTFHSDRQDPQFLEEKKLIITTLAKIQPIPSDP